MHQMNLGLPGCPPTSPLLDVQVSRENVHPEDTRLFEGSYSYGAQAIAMVSRALPFLPPSDLTRIQKIIQDRYRQYIIEERSFCMSCGSPRVACVEDEHGNNAYQCRDCRAINEDVDEVRIDDEEREHVWEAA